MWTRPDLNLLQLPGPFKQLLKELLFIPRFISIKNGIGIGKEKMVLKHLLIKDKCIFLHFKIQLWGTLALKNSFLLNVCQSIT